MVIKSVEDDKNLDITDRNTARSIMNNVESQTLSLEELKAIVNDNNFLGE